MTSTLRILNAAILASSALMGMQSALAQKFPSDRVTLIVPYSPGNGLDLLARELAGELQTQEGVPFVVENREGAAGVIGTQHAARAKADGYTLLFTANPPFATSPFSLDKPPYDPLSSFVPVARVGSVPLVLVTAPQWPIQNLEQLKDYVAKNPDKANYASSGVGSPGQLYGEKLNQAMGIRLQDVRYRATGQALLDVVAGSVLVSIVSVTAAEQHVKAGKLRMLAVGSRKRLSSFPDVPTLAEATGQRDFEAGVWYGFFAPAGTSKERVTALFASASKAASSPRVQSFMDRVGMVPELLDPDAFSKQLQADVSSSKRLVEEARSRPER
ncbi:Bug family tripartite tricarboxylate transporter substrate binding protein [Hydrogenophaga sp. BPS33]|uniref:Bug family tripartite tricarboxylate transporter substrate binding protein n=1 Tax=Hydrogenophaga sp. BPS33 TaxID=2651974 RepID=UPI00131F4A00|nr:tripartite tricarboxylate transporter substrate binding protein [Hydrogenophaga sp. BPS33]QHE88136.1 tripartite tricarboxylate transporter substrate binding protein [Hydrogenophaga sp. BPS33]